MITEPELEIAPQTSRGKIGAFNKSDAFEFAMTEQS